MKKKLSENIGIILSIPIGIAVNLLTNYFSFWVAFVLIILSGALLLYILLSDKLIDFINENNRQKKLKQIKSMENEIDELEQLRADIPKMVSRIAWDLFRVIIMSSLYTILIFLLSIMLFTTRTFSSSSYFLPIFTFILYAVLILYTSEVKRMKYVQKLSDFDGYKKSALEKIKNLSDPKSEEQADLSKDNTKITFIEK